jgi:hypothetical protein
VLIAQNPCGEITDEGNRREEIEGHKNDQLNKQKDGRGEWKGELGSNSENAVCLFSLVMHHRVWKIGGGEGRVRGVLYIVCFPFHFVVILASVFM